ncbi:hypothetical protein [Pseudomonas tremae]|uniref:hypothetical protein n=1 Tax=Pseudomonas tremae TaxID=200454 RepID=UPI0003FB2679|nr:hypothetical protein [Pseudomonas tremae]
MIFYLDGSLKSVDGSNVQPHFVDFMENLCIARKNGRHIIFSDIPTLEHLAQINSLGQRTCATLVKVSKRVRGKLAIFESCTTYVRVVAMSGTFRKLVLPNGKEEIQVSSDVITSDEFFYKTRFLVENRTDGLFYGGLAMLALRREANWQNLHLNYEIVAGGGSQTPREYGNLKSTQQLTLCMVDSDVDFDGASYGNNTAAPIYAMDQATPPVTSKSIILNCYSAENLIHPVLLKHALKLNGRENWYIQISDYFKQDFWMFLALKQQKTCMDFSPNTPKGSYWHAKRTSFPTLASHPICVTNHCATFTPLASVTLSRVAIHLQENNFPYLSDIVFDEHSLFSEWAAVSRNLFSWACSGDRMSSV